MRAAVPAIIAMRTPLILVCSRRPGACEAGAGGGAEPMAAGCWWCLLVSLARS
jgi:hypothetical protein